MNAADVIGYIVGGDYFCETCAPRTEGEDVAPIFGSSEADSFSHCCECEDLIPETLTSEGIGYVIGSLREFLVSRSGRAEILSMWAEEIRSYGLGPEEKAIFDVAWDALTHENLKAAKGVR